MQTCCAIIFIPVEKVIGGELAAPVPLQIITCYTCEDTFITLFTFVHELVRQI